MFFLLLSAAALSALFMTPERGGGEAEAQAGILRSTIESFS
jgi:hypothetical protein